MKEIKYVPSQAFRKARGDVHQEGLAVRGIISIGTSGFLGLMPRREFLIICWFVCQLKVPHPSQEWWKKHVDYVWGDKRRPLSAWGVFFNHRFVIETSQPTTEYKAYVLRSCRLHSICYHFVIWKLAWVHPPELHLGPSPLRNLCSVDL